MCDCQQNSPRQAEPVAGRVETRLTAVDCSLPEVKAELRQLSQLLLSSRALWSVRSFEHHKLPWQQRFAKLAAALWAIDDDALETVDASQSLLLATLWPALAADLSEQELACGTRDTLPGTSLIIPHLSRIMANLSFVRQLRPGSVPV